MWEVIEATIYHEGIVSIRNQIYNIGVCSAVIDVVGGLTISKQEHRVHTTRNNNLKWVGLGASSDSFGLHIPFNLFTEHIQTSYTIL